MSYARVAAGLLWLYCAGFGLSTIPVARYLLRHDKLPTFLGLFPLYGGRWFGKVGNGRFILLLMGFLVTTVAAAGAAWLLWNGSRIGAVITLALLPLQAIFWVGFDLPLPWLTGIATVILVALGWSSLG